jgi:hypothetical protein
MFNGKIHYFDWAIFNSELLVYQRVPHWTVICSRSSAGLQTLWWNSMAQQGPLTLPAWDMRRCLAAPGSWRSDVHPGLVAMVAMVIFIRKYSPNSDHLILKNGTPPIKKSCLGFINPGLTSLGQVGYPRYSHPASIWFFSPPCGYDVAKCWALIIIPNLGWFVLYNPLAFCCTWKRT